MGFGLAVVIGGVVGSGIMRNPSVVAEGFPNAGWILLAWLAGGLFVMIDAMPTVELGAAIPLAGGTYSIVTRAIGPRAGFMVGWCTAAQIIISTGFITVAFGDYLHRLGWLPGLTAGQIGILLVLGCGLVNGVGARTEGRLQETGSALKALGLVVLVAALFFGDVSAAPAAAPPPPPFMWVTAMVALRAIYGAYGGWEATIYFSEEVQAPERNVVRATFSGIAIVGVLYLLVNAAVLHVLPIGALAHSTLAAADAAAVVFGGQSGVIVTGLAILCVATIANTQVLEVSRVLFAMARLGVLPPGLARVSESGAPRIALMAGIGATIIVIAAADSVKGQLYEILLDLYAPIIMIQFLMMSIAAIWLRRAEPGLSRPFRMPLYPLPALLSISLNALLIALFLQSDWKTGLCSALLLLCAVPVYMIGRRRWRAESEAAAG